MEPKANEVWYTKQGNIVLIIENIEDSGIIRTGLKMLWFDLIDKTWTVSDLMQRLQSKSAMTSDQFFRMASEDASTLRKVSPDPYSGPMGIFTDYEGDNNGHLRNNEST